MDILVLGEFVKLTLFKGSFWWMILFLKAYMSWLPGPRNDINALLVITRPFIFLQFQFKKGFKLNNLKCSSFPIFNPFWGCLFVICVFNNDYNWKVGMWGFWSFFLIFCIVCLNLFYDLKLKFLERYDVRWYQINFDV